MFHSYLKPASQSVRLWHSEKRRYKKDNSEPERRIARFESPQAITNENQMDENQIYSNLADKSLRDGKPGKLAVARRRVNV
jgi:hypothetical protein